MARLIDADKLRQAMDGKNEYATLCRWQILEVIDRQPTVDAVPASHGNWVIWHGAYRLDGKFVIDEYNCSNCNESSEYATKYCPHCGAKMDENGGDSNAVD